ncbi:lipocalin-like domain-containing protein [bacterium]|nr:lipocalin-like domain-containing protein [bacterium]
MRFLVGTLVWLASTQAMGASIEGVWRLDEWKVRNAAGEEAEFCKGAHGYLIYEGSGVVSTSINCPKKQVSGAEPADAFGRVFFYAGTYTEKGGTIYKDVQNATFEPLIGKTVLRKIEKVTSDELILTGPFGAPGNSLWIRWTR